MSHHTSVEIKNPGSWQVSSAAKSAFLVMTALGVVTVGAGFASGQADRVWANILVDNFYFMCIALGALFFVALQFVTNAMWSTPIRRVAEGLTTYLPFAAIFSLLILTVGGHSLYEWMHADAVKHDALLASKTGYLNSKFALIRSVLAFGLWILFAKKIVGNSLAQDANGNKSYTLENNKWSAIFILIFAISFSFLSFDYIMSIEAHWFSTMFGVYAFAGLVYSTLCTIAILTVTMKQRGLLPLVNENHLHDIGKLMFGFTVFWAYIGFSQFMLIWYANMPEETIYYMKRAQGGWYYLCWFLLIAKFIIPFFALLPRGAKRQECYLRAMATFMLLAHWLDVYILVMPNVFAKGPTIGWIEIGTALGFFGLFAFVVSSFYSKVPVMAYNDPRIQEGAAHTVAP